MIRRLALVAGLLWGAAARAQTPTVLVEGRAAGLGPGELARVLSAPHVVVGPDSGRYLIARGTDHPQAVVVLGRDAVVEGQVRGDVVVVGGDLYMHPGAAISGGAIAIGGGVYESSLAVVTGGARSYRDFTYDVTAIPGGYSLRYRLLAPAPEPGLSLPGIAGLTLPTYDRSNGLYLGLAPRLTLRSRPLVVVPSLTYRSQLGRLDPTVTGQFAVDDRTTLTLTAARTTRSNDRWIRGELANSVLFFLEGDDTRNYYRASVAELRAERTVKMEGSAWTPFAGVAAERSRSVRPGPDASGGPWTLLERGDPHREDRLRVNPPIDAGLILSVIAGTAGGWSGADLSGRADLRGELGQLAGADGGRSSAQFGQVTLDGRIEFPTFGSQSLRFDAHVVATAGTAPRQRYAWIGGGGTIPTIGLLSEGGDQLMFVDATYQVPLVGFDLPLVGPPVIGLREILGGAAVKAFPSIHQAIGIRATAALIYAEWLVDPATRAGRFSAGVSFER